MAKKISAPQTSTGGNFYVNELVIRLTLQELRNKNCVTGNAHGCGSASDFHRLPQLRRLLNCGRNKPLFDRPGKEALRSEPWNIEDSAAPECM